MKKVMSNTGVSKIFVKICGITNRDDAFLAVGLGCDALGFNFVANSKRKVEIRHLHCALFTPKCAFTHYFRQTCNKIHLSIGRKCGFILIVCYD